MDTETEEENKEHSEEKFKSTDPKYHQNVKKPLKNKNTLIKQKIKTNKPDILTKYFEVEKEVPTTEDHQAEEEKEDQWNRYFGDKDTELEQKLEELTPSSQHPPKFPAKLATTPEPAFHEWRQFVDNNPNFPYTIPKSAKKTTKIPTTKRPTKKPSTEKHTEKSTEKVTTTVRPSIASEKPKTTETERVENNNYGKLWHVKMVIGTVKVLGVISGKCPCLAFGRLPAVLRGGTFQGNCEPYLKFQTIV